MRVMDQVATNNDSLLSELVQNSADAIIVTNSQKCITNLNKAAERMFNRRKKELIGEPLTTVLPIALRDRVGTKTNKVKPERRKGKSQRIVTGIRANGQHSLFEASLVDVSVQDETLHLIFLRDVLRSETANEERKINMQRLEIIADLAPAGILQISDQWHCTSVNSTFCHWSGLEQHQITGRNWINIIDQNDALAFFAAFQKAMLNGSEFSGECRLRNSNGETRWVSCTARALLNATGNVVGYLCTFIDLTRQQHLVNNDDENPHYDPLTGLASYLLFSDRLEHACVRTERHPMIALLYIDLDGFKAVNQSIGRDSGNMLLREIAKRLQTCIRKEDTLARLGSDEFAALLEGIRDARQAAVIAENIVNAFRIPFLIQDSRIPITVSIGIAINQGNKQSPHSVMNQASVAMISARESGRNSYQFFTPELNKVSRLRMTLGNDLQLALQNKEFCVDYQPMIDMLSSRIIGTEALLRWPHSKKGFISPKQFIPIMEERGMIATVEEWLIGHAIAQHKQWVKQYPGAYHAIISVNLSAKQFLHGKIVDSVQRALEKNELPPDRLCLEITENSLMNDSGAAKTVLHGLKRVGVRIALDDFGTGYSSLSYLKKFPIDFIKIDRSFVRDVLVDDENAAVTKAIINLGHSLNIAVIAEGVDSAEKLEFLREHDCDVVQGHFLGRPVAPQLITWNKIWQAEEQVANH